MNNRTDISAKLECEASSTPEFFTVSTLGKSLSLRLDDQQDIAPGADFYENPPTPQFEMISPADESPEVNASIIERLGNFWSSPRFGQEVAQAPFFTGEISRSLQVYFPDRPELGRFGLGGIGQIRYREHHGTRRIFQIYPVEQAVTISDYHRKVEGNMKRGGTSYILKDGSQLDVRSRAPLGAATLDDVDRKISNTLLIERLKGLPFLIPKFIAKVKLSEETGGWIYQLPQFFVQPMALVQIDLHMTVQLKKQGRLPMEIFGSYARLLAQSVRFLHQNNFVHNQLHAGNIGYDFATGKPVITDFSTLQDISQHETRLMVQKGNKLSQILSPKETAQMYDFQRMLKSLLNLYLLGKYCPAPDIYTCGLTTHQDEVERILELLESQSGKHNNIFEKLEAIKNSESDSIIKDAIILGLYASYGYQGLKTPNKQQLFKEIEEIFEMAKNLVSLQTDGVLTSKPDFVTATQNTISDLIASRTLSIMRYGRESVRMHTAPARNTPNTRAPKTKRKKVKRKS